MVRHTMRQLRTCLLYTSPLILVLNSMFGLDGVIYAQPVADYISIVLSVVICMLIFKNMEHVEKEDLIDQEE